MVLLITEEIIDEAIMTQALRSRRGHVARQRSHLLARARARSARTIDSSNKLTMRSKRAARGIVRKLVIHKMGLNDAELTDRQKIHISRLVSNKRALINNIAKKLYNKVRKDDFEQYQKAKAERLQ